MLTFTRSQSFLGLLLEFTTLEKVGELKKLVLCIACIGYG